MTHVQAAIAALNTFDEQVNLAVDAGELTADQGYDISKGVAEATYTLDDVRAEQEGEDS